MNNPFKQDTDNLNVIQAICKQIEDSEYKPNHITLIYEDLPENFKSEEDGFDNEDIVSMIIEDGKPIIKKYNT